MFCKHHKIHTHLLARVNNPASDPQFPRGTWVEDLTPTNPHPIIRACASLSGALSSPSCRGTSAKWPLWYFQNHRRPPTRRWGLLQPSVCLLKRPQAKKSFGFLQVLKIFTHLFLPPLQALEFFLKAEEGIRQLISQNPFKMHLSMHLTFLNLLLSWSKLLQQKPAHAREDLPGPERQREGAAVAKQS